VEFIRLPTACGHSFCVVDGIDSRRSRNDKCPPLGLGAGLVGLMGWSVSRRLGVFACGDVA
jgi:hypothetical protein